MPCTPLHQDGDHWRDHVVVPSHVLGRLLGVDPKAIVMRVWADHDADFVHVLAASADPIEPGQMVARGGCADQRFFEDTGPTPPRFFVPVDHGYVELHDRQTGRRYACIHQPLEMVLTALEQRLKIEDPAGVEVIEVDGVGPGMAVHQGLQKMGFNVKSASLPIPAAAH